MPSPKFCSNCGTPWLNSPAYKKCCSCNWKPSAAPKKTKKKEPHHDPPDDSDDGVQILNDNEQWLQEAIKKKTIKANEKTAFATNISQAVKKEKLHEETRLEAKQERQKKVVKDRHDKNEKRQGVQGGFGHDPRNEPAFFEYREIEIWMMEDGVQMYRWHNTGQFKKICLSDNLANIDEFVREHVHGHDKWMNRTDTDLVEDYSVKAYIAYQAGNSPPFEFLFDCSATSTWGDFLMEFNSIKVRKDKAKLVFAFPAKQSEAQGPPRRSTIAIPRPNNKRSRNRLRGSEEGSGEEEGLCVKAEPQEAGNADDPENGNSYYLPGIAALGGSAVKLENPDNSGDDVNEPPEDSEDEEDGGDEGDGEDEGDGDDEGDKTFQPESSPPPAHVTKSGRKRALSGKA